MLIITNNGGIVLLEFNSINELLRKTDEIVGKTFGELDTEGYFEKYKHDKGIFGKIVETGFYGYPNNNRAEADFDKLGIELKVSGFVTTKKGLWSAKERISLSQINFHKIVNEDFKFSSLISKNRKILFIWYEYVENGDPREFIIKDYQLYDMTGIEPLIENDYQIIRQTVRDGLAHKLSEGDSVILGAATKGGAGQTQTQPFSEIRAKTRAFSIKNSFIKGVLREHRLNYNVSLPVELTPEEWLWNKFKKYKGITQSELLKQLDPQSSKEKPQYNIGNMIQRRIIGTEFDLEKNELFSKLTYEIKTTPINESYFPIEKPTFKPLQKDEFLDNWDTSDWKTFFEESTFFYLGYLEDSKNKGNGHRKLHCLFKVTFTPEEVDEFSKTYNDIKNAVTFNDVNLLPTATKYPNRSLVVSTKGSGGDKCYHQFMYGEKKVCFMFNKEFIYKKFMEGPIFK